MKQIVDILQHQGLTSMLFKLLLMRRKPSKSIISLYLLTRLLLDDIWYPQERFQILTAIMLKIRSNFSSILFRMGILITILVLLKQLATLMLTCWTMPLI